MEEETYASSEEKAQEGLVMWYWIDKVDACSCQVSGHSHFVINSVSLDVDSLWFLRLMRSVDCGDVWKG